MKIDTLVLSGGSTKVPAFIGALRALKELRIINDTLDGINHIITCSVGMLYGLMLLLKVNDNVIEETIKRFCFSAVLDIDLVSINSLLFDMGLFDNHKVTSIITTILREKYSKTNMTMVELYNLTKIKLTVKVCNHTKACTEYISYETDPELSITTLLQMTTAIPIFFKPVVYNECLYVDGGVSGGFAIEHAGDNYLGINLKGPSSTHTDNYITEVVPIINFITRLLSISATDSSIKSSRNIQLVSTINFINFDLSVDEKKELVENGYSSTVEHIKEYSLTNDLFNELHPEDTDPT